jgi:hypothetical protein
MAAHFGRQACRIDPQLGEVVAGAGLVIDGSVSGEPLDRRS